MVKNLPATEGDIGDVALIPGLGRSPGGGSGNSLQYSCLEKSHGQRSLVGHGPWGHKKSQTQQSNSAYTHRQASLHVVQEAGGLHLKGTSCISHLEK